MGILILSFELKFFSKVTGKGQKLMLFLQKNVFKLRPFIIFILFLEQKQNLLFIEERRSYL